MTYEEFLKLAKKCPQYEEKIIPIKNYYHKKDQTRYSMLYTEACTGGTTGGSCWDDGTRDSHYGFSSNDRLYELDIDFFLTRFAPNISYLEYKKLIGELNIVKGTYTENEYYGNSTNYQYHYILIIDLYNKFKELNII